MSTPAGGAAAAQRVRQRNRDESGVDQPTCHIRQQGCVEHVVDRRDDRDVDRRVGLA